jgi:hypothetical protein
MKILRTVQILHISKKGTISFLIAGWMLTCAFSNGDPVLLKVGSREIPSSEFIYYLKKQTGDSGACNLDHFVKQFTEMQLKVAQAKEEQLDRTIGFITESTNYRSQLAAPYLTDREKEEELVQEAYERWLYEIDASQILVRADLPDTLSAFRKAIQLRDRILKGERFAEVAFLYSDDPEAKTDSGRLGYFTVFQAPYPVESTAFKMKPGELSFPVRTESGYFILLCHDIRKNSEFGEHLPGFDEVKGELLKWIKRDIDSRSHMIREFLARRLKTEWSFTESKDVLSDLFALTELAVRNSEIEFPENLKRDRILCTIDGKNLTTGDFFRFIADNDTNSGTRVIKTDLPVLYQRFVTERLITYENYKLEEKYPDFRLRLREFRDANLLLEITRREVWQKSASDTSGLIAFYKKNRRHYPKDEPSGISGKAKDDLSGIPDSVFSDYQDYLMKAWVEKLRKKYPVDVNRGVLSEIRKKVRAGRH